MAAALLFLLTLAFLAAAALTLRRDIHLFQLNSYQPRAHLARVRETFAVEALPRRWPGAAALLVAWLPFFVAAVPGIVLFLAQARWNRPRPAKIALAYTPRVKRLAAALAVLHILLVAAVWHGGGGYAAQLHGGLNAPFWYALALCASPFALFLANLLMAPVERLINQRYIADARRILAAHPGLVVIGVTGSYGKTSVKNFLHRLLSMKYTVLMTPGNYNTTLGVVRTLRGDLRPQHAVFVCEMGARRRGDIKEICDLVRPRHGMVTAVGPQHLESFKTLEAVVATKAELLLALPEGGMAVVNAGCPALPRAPGTENVSYCLEPGVADYVARAVTASAAGSSFRVRLADGRDVCFETRLIGRHNVLNITAAIAMADRLGVPAEDMAIAVRRLDSVPHRLQLRSAGPGLTILDDAYNANASGAQAALDALAMFAGLRVLITPGMVELGSQEDELNREFGRAAAAVCERVYIVVGGSRAQSIRDGLQQGGMAEERITAAASVPEALGMVQTLDAEGREKVVLLENDLPDNYSF